MIVPRADLTIADNAIIAHYVLQKHWQTTEDSTIIQRSH